MIIIFFFLILSTTATYNSTNYKITSPCIYGYHFQVKNESEQFYECYTFDQNELLVEGKLLNLGVYISEKYINTYQTSRCGECLEISSTGGTTYKVMISGYHKNKDENLIYGSESTFNGLSIIHDGITLIPISLRIVPCPFNVLPTIVVTETNSTHVQLQPINVLLPHYLIQYNKKEYHVDKYTGKYTLPYFEKATIKLISLQRIGLKFENVISTKNKHIEAVAQFPSFEVVGTCHYIPQIVVFDQNSTASMKHLDNSFRWQLYRVTPSKQLKPIEIKNNQLEFSFSTEEIEIVLGFPTYFQMNRYYNLLEFQFVSDCSVSFDTVEMFTLAKVEKFETDKIVQCSDVSSFYRSMEYKNELGNVQSYGNLLKISIDSSCSSYINFFSIKLKGIIG